MGLYMLNQGLLPLGTLFAGAMAQAWGAPVAVRVMGTSVLAMSALALALLPAARNL
jgi:hypothetical protein